MRVEVEQSGKILYSIEIINGNERDLIHKCRQMFPGCSIYLYVPSKMSQMNFDDLEITVEDYKQQFAA